jgi:hypothetical protein
MERRNRPFKQACKWCGNEFSARDGSDSYCSPGCAEEFFQRRVELTLVQDQFRSLNEKVDALHERIFRIHRRIERQVAKLQKLGARWASTTDGDKLFDIERQEKKTSLILGRLNDECFKRDEQAKPGERALFRLERAVNRLRKLVGDS